MNAAEPSYPEDLLAHADALRRLARALLRDKGAAEDVVQQAFVTALERPPRSRSVLGAWLRRVVRRKVIDFERSRQRRDQREHAVAHAESLRSHAETERALALQRDVVDAVADLREPYRTTVYQRYYENLAPGAIAAQQGVPVKTVKTRLWRGLEMLRSRIDAEHHDRRIWAAMLLPIAAGDAAPPIAAGAVAAPAAAGVIAMNLKPAAGIVIGCALLGALLLVVASGWGDRHLSGPSESGAPTVAAQEQSGAEPGFGPSSAFPPEPNERDAVAPTAESRTGSLLLSLVWSDDRSPARGVRVNVSAPDGELLYPTSTRTNDVGQFLFEGLAPDDISPHYFITESKTGRSVRVFGGQQAEATIEIEPSLSVRGRVVDGSANPVSGADIVVAGWAERTTHVVARSAVDGTFGTRGLPTSCHIGARRRGYGPTPMRTFTTESGANVEFTIVMDRPGGSLSGTVLGPDGKPAPRAEVRVGTIDGTIKSLPDGGQGMAPQPEMQETDDRGRFAFASVAARKVPVAVRCDGFAPWQESIEVSEDRETEITVLLSRGSTVFGVAKDAQGKPVSRAFIACGNVPDFGARWIRTAADGSFRLEGLGAGELRVTARHDAAGSAEETFFMMNGEERRWDPVLASGVQMHGIVLDCDGEPVPGAIVEGQLDPWVPGKSWFVFENTDKAGRFTFRNCIPDATIRISVRTKSTFPDLSLTKVLPSAEELEIRLPKAAWIHITGKIVGPDDEVLGNVRVSPHLMENGSSSSPVETVGHETSTFRLGPYPPGKYRLEFAAEGFPTVRVERTIAPDEILDLGTLRFAPGGTLALQLLAGTMTVPESLRSSIFDSDRTYRGVIELENGIGKSPLLPPGDYFVTIHSDEIAPETVKFTIRAGRATKVDVPIRPRKQ